MFLTACLIHLGEFRPPHLLFSDAGYCRNSPPPPPLAAPAAPPRLCEETRTSVGAAQTLRTIWTFKTFNLLKKVFHCGRKRVEEPDRKPARLRRVLEGPGRPWKALEGPGGTPSELRHVPPSGNRQAWPCHREATERLKYDPSEMKLQLLVRVCCFDSDQ